MEEEKCVIRCDICGEPIESEEDEIVVCDGSYEYTYDGNCISMHYGCYENESCFPLGTVMVYDPNKVLEDIVKKLEGGKSYGSHIFG